MGAEDEVILYILLLQEMDLPDVPDLTDQDKQLLVSALISSVTQCILFMHTLHAAHKEQLMTPAPLTAICGVRRHFGGIWDTSTRILVTILSMQTRRKVNSL